MKEFPNTGCYCEWVTFKPCPYCQIHFTWDVLTKTEQAVVLNYKRLLILNKEIPKELVNAVNIIHDKYIEFSMAVVP